MLNIVINDHGLRQFEELLKGLTGAQARRVMADALNKSGAKTRTQVKRELSRETGIKYSDIDRGRALRKRHHRPSILFSFRAVPRQI